MDMKGEGARGIKQVLALEVDILAALLMILSAYGFFMLTFAWDVEILGPTGFIWGPVSVHTFQVLFGWLVTMSPDPGVAAGILLLTATGCLLFLLRRRGTRFALMSGITFVSVVIFFFELSVFTFSAYYDNLRWENAQVIGAQVIYGIVPWFTNKDLLVSSAVAVATLSTAWVIGSTRGGFRKKGPR